MVPSSTDPLADAPLPRVAERRAEIERRTSERRQLVLMPPVERRAGGPRRDPGERRTGPERRALETAEEHVRNALQLLMNIVDTASLDDDLRRNIDSVIFRLHFAIERMERDAP
jgi:hypothetical protein